MHVHGGTICPFDRNSYLLIARIMQVTDLFFCWESVNHMNVAKKKNFLLNNTFDLNPNWREHLISFLNISQVRTCFQEGRQNKFVNNVSITLTHKSNCSIIHHYQNMEVVTCYVLD